MADARQFAKLDLGYFDNPKVADFVEDHPHVLMLHLRAILYSRQHLMDGKFPVRIVARMVSATYCGSECASECDYCRAVDADLFERIDARTGLVHDYLEHQLSAKDAERLSSAGKKGAAARWGGNSDADGNADGIAKGSPDGNAERERREREKREAPAGAPRPDVEALCDLLADLVEANGSKRPTVTARWRDSARLMLDTDKRPLAEAKSVMRWSQASDFWKGNVLSMPKFRDKYDTLRLQSEREQPHQQQARPSMWETATKIGDWT